MSSLALLYSVSEVSMHHKNEHFCSVITLGNEMILY